MKRLTASLVFLALTSACNTESSTPDKPVTFPEAALSTIQSTGGALSIEVRTGPAQPPARGETSIEFVVTDGAGNPVDGLDIRPQLWMPIMGHGSSTEPTVEAEGQGKYVFNRCELFMPGQWELRATISGGTEDDATAKFQIP